MLSILLSFAVSLISIHYVTPFFTYFLSDIFSIWFVKQVVSHVGVLSHILQFKHWKSLEDSCNWQIIQILSSTLGLNLAKYPLLRLTQTSRTTKCNVYVWKVLSCQRQIFLWYLVNNFPLSSGREGYGIPNISTVDCKLNPYLCFCDENPGLFSLSNSAFCLKQLNKHNNHFSISFLFVQKNMYTFFVAKAKTYKVWVIQKAVFSTFYLFSVNAGL